MRLSQSIRSLLVHPRTSPNQKTSANVSIKFHAGTVTRPTLGKQAKRLELGYRTSRLNIADYHLPLLLFSVLTCTETPKRLNSRFQISSSLCHSRHSEEGNSLCQNVNNSTVSRLFFDEFLHLNSTELYRWSQRFRNSDHSGTPSACYNLIYILIELIKAYRNDINQRTLAHLPCF